MGMLIYFFAGDAKLIGAALAQGGLSPRRIAVASADFSLHLTPEHIDSLGEVIATRAGHGLVPLVENLSQPRSGSASGSSSAHMVGESWVQMVASLADMDDEDDANGAERIAAEWIRTISEEIEDECEVSPYAIEAVDSLIALCQLAVREKLDVVFWWSL